MDNPTQCKKNLVGKANELLLMTFETAEERLLAKQNMAWEEKNPKAITATPLQKIVASLRKVFLKHAHGSSKGLNIVNPYNTLMEFLRISPAYLRAACVEEFFPHPSTYHILWLSAPRSLQHTFPMSVIWRGPMLFSSLNRVLILPIHPPAPISLENP
ncbi:hypothetical protein PCANC_24134 [Puccinia coronata f. sp. avenae]|uniref:Uncharacterized protein n=1 Tax=Puccinia coronata f. sp. avenae TaxID=200324 RepID=A0A2N5TYW3_9BASI|nr:hypothetical protein PCANC_24134 [Puccinia coronata f. sp. avenae]